jgi:dTDP-4-amino-4,6-dideoxygalactose transaminase
MAGATPVFADIDPNRLTLDPAAIEAVITPRTAAILPVHLYGQPADMTAISAIAQRRNLVVLEDACQAHLARCAGRPVGAFGVAAAFSFYPTKNLGALGDGGAVTTSDARLADKLRRLRNGGQADKYRHVEFGVNSRLDDVQAAILRARLKRLEAWTAHRRALAAAYRAQLAGAPVRVPPECDPGHVYHLFPVLSDRRDDFRAHLEAQGIGTLVHYPFTLPDQPAFAANAQDDCPVARRIARDVCSLPLHHELPMEHVSIVTEAVRTFRS